ncbi:MAG TPA: hypothetical protein VFV75_19565 [Candidatus Polarisedimenticolaceae bacterium]|nr:hypothetical protein [Candidatus Polarisedimenticolaceae bacterium]
MTQPNRFNAAQAVAALLLATGLPALAQAATSRSTAPAKAEATRPARQQATAQRISPVLEFLAQSVGDGQETMASPHLPPGRPADRPPATPPGQTDPPNPPGKPGDRPPAR